MCTFTDYSGTSMSLALYISYPVFVFDDILVTVGIVLCAIVTASLS